MACPCPQGLGALLVIVLCLHLPVCSGMLNKGFCHLAANPLTCQMQISSQTLSDHYPSKFKFVFFSEETCSVFMYTCNMLAQMQIK